MKTQVKTQQEIVDMRESGRILATILQDLIEGTEAGMTTSDIDKRARALLEKHKSKAAFLDYNGFPGAICISVNDEIAHGIPGNRVMREGDLIHYDFGVRYKGMITDAGIGFVIGTPTPDQQRLLAGTVKALDAAIATIRDGVRVGDIGAAVESTLERYDLACIYELCGHGVGHQVHEDPIIPNYGTAGTGEALRTGMTVALEPNVSLGSHEMYLAEDGWTWTTKDHSLSTQAEHTVLVTDDGCEILTQL